MNMGVYYSLYCSRIRVAIDFALAAGHRVATPLAQSETAGPQTLEGGTQEEARSPHLACKQRLSMIVYL